MKIVFTLLLSLALQAQAHEAGHGPKIPGRGPNGGELTAIVAASEAEKGADAHVQALAEWVLRDSEIEIHLWTESKTKSVHVPKGDAKWIFLFDEPAKPIVVTKHSEGSVLKHTLPPKTKIVEVILPGLESAKDKHVFAMGLR